MECSNVIASSRHVAAGRAASSTSENWLLLGTARDQRLADIDALCLQQAAQAPGVGAVTYIYMEPYATVACSGVGAACFCARASGPWCIVAIFYPFSQFCEIDISLLSLQKQPTTAPNLFQRGVEYGKYDGEGGCAADLEVLYGQLSN